jgi:transposase-like protein
MNDSLARIMAEPPRPESRSDEHSGAVIPRDGNWRNPPPVTVSSTAPRPRKPRRTYTDAEKRRIIADYDAAPWGSKADVLRREQITSQSLLTRWRGEFAGITHSRTAKAMPSPLDLIDSSIRQTGDMPTVIADYIADAIAAGTLTPGMKLLSSIKLGKAFGVSANTAGSALRQLRTRGLAQLAGAHRARGTYIKNAP